MWPMPTHDDLLLEGHDAGWDGQGCCPNCTARMDDCNCCPICEGNGRVRDQGKYQLCPACDGEGTIPPKAVLDQVEDKGPL